MNTSHTTFPDTGVDGTKTPVVFLHGIFLCKESLYPQCRALSENGRKVIALDARNHGDSGHSLQHTHLDMLDDLTGFVQDQKLDKPIIMGHSMGGKTVMFMALSKPELIRALIVVDSTLKLPPGGISHFQGHLDAMAAVSIPKGTPFEQARQMAMDQLTTAFPEELARHRIVRDQLKQFEDGSVGWRMSIDGMKSFIKAEMSIVGGTKPATLTPFTKPTLFVIGEDSFYNKPEAQEGVDKMFPNAEFKTISGAAHYVQDDQPEEFNKVVNEFLDRVENKSS